MMILTRNSDLTGETHTREIPADGAKVLDWIQHRDERPLIQDAFPALSDDDREFILTGITPNEWDAVMQEPEQ